MSNRKRAKRQLSLNPQLRDSVILREENKNAVAKLFGYSIETVNDILAKAKAQGYSGVELPIIKH